jgi:hypothetical protein
MISSSDFTDNSLIGIATVINGRAIITKTLANDLLAEGFDAFTVNIRTGSYSGPIVAKSPIISVVDTSLPTITVNTITVNEASPVTFTISSNRRSSLLYWTLNPIGGTINSLDFNGGATSGSFTTNGSGSFSLTLELAPDATTEGTEGFQLQVRTGSISGNIIATSPTVAIDDTSIQSAFSYGFSSSESNTNQIPVPCNIWYRRNIFQTVYTAAELSANGAVAGAQFNNLKWYITDAVPSTESVRGLNIKIFHTTNTDSSSAASPISTKTTVYSVSDATDVTQFESLGPCTFNFTNTFTWDGVNNICIESCTAENELQYLARGTQRIVNVANGSISRQIDANGTSCGDTPNQTGRPFKLSVEMDYTISQVAVVNASLSGMSENFSVTFTVNTTNFPSGILYWDLEQVDGTINNSDFTGPLSGTVNISSSTGSIILNTAPDFTTEGPESFRLRVRTDGPSGNIIGTSPTIAIADTSQTPLPPPTATVNPSTTSLTEGSAVTFTVNTTNFASGTLNWTLNTISGTITTSDFIEGVTSGSFPISSSTGSVVLTLNDDFIAEGTESFQLQVRTSDSTIIGTSATITITESLSSSIQALASYMSGFMSEYKNPSFYEYTLNGDDTSITDGGFDMYDPPGNVTTPWLIAGTDYTPDPEIGLASYTNRISYANTTATTVDTNFVYASVSGYTQLGTTRPLMVIGTRSGTGNPIGWQKGGNIGADTSGGSNLGILGSEFVYLADTVSGFTVTAYTRQTWGTGSSPPDPSICDLYILLGHPNWNSTFGIINNFSNGSTDSCGGYLYTSGAGVKNVLAITTLLSKQNGVQVTTAECQTVINNIINRVRLYFGYSDSIPVSELYAFTTATFNTGGLNGITGPNITQARSALTGPEVATWSTNTSFFNMVTTGIQLWTVPATASYRITAAGASSASGGLGANIQGTFSLTQGQIIQILVGQQGIQNGGGGGSYVVKNGASTTADIYLIAGGGGGKTGGSGGTATTSNSTGTVSNGNGGNANNTAYNGAAGGGFLTSGTVSTGTPTGNVGSGFLQGGLGAATAGGGSGGFGGGGSAGVDSQAGGGGGGGYSGGDGTADSTSGKGAGSFPNGTNQSNTANAQSGSGFVTITKL